MKDTCKAYKRLVDGLHKLMENAPEERYGCFLTQVISVSEIENLISSIEKELDK